MAGLCASRISTGMRRFEEEVMIVGLFALVGATVGAAVGGVRGALGGAVGLPMLFLAATWLLGW